MKYSYSSRVEALKHVLGPLCAYHQVSYRFEKRKDTGAERRYGEASTGGERRVPAAVDVSYLVTVCIIHLQFVYASTTFHIRPVFCLLTWNREERSREERSREERRYWSREERR